MRKSLVLFSLYSCVMVTGLLYAADKEIEFEEERNTASNFIMRAKLDPKNDPFAITEIIHYNKEAETFTVKSYVVDASEEDLAEIFKGNFVYTPFYKLEKTFRSYGWYENIGAFIIMATNVNEQELIEKLNFARIKRRILNIDKK